MTTEQEKRDIEYERRETAELYPAGSPEVLTDPQEWWRLAGVLIDADQVDDDELVTRLDVVRQEETVVDRVVRRVGPVEWTVESERLVTVYRAFVR